MLYHGKFCSLNRIACIHCGLPSGSGASTRIFPPPPLTDIRVGAHRVLHAHTYTNASVHRVHYYNNVRTNAAYQQPFSSRFPPNRCFGAVITRPAGGYCTRCCTRPYTRLRSPPRAMNASATSSAPPPPCAIRVRCVCPPDTRRSTVREHITSTSGRYPHGEVLRTYKRDDDRDGER
jgi:hypothetical protein